jgi:hypothetical protein
MRKTTSACLLALVCLAGLAAPPVARAQDRKSVVDLYTRGPYRQEVPRPESLLGYELGARETTYWEQDRVVRAIADAAKDRMRVIPYGQSVEGRPLKIVVVSAPENLARVDEIRQRNLRYSDPRGLAEAEANEIARTAPVIVWINENVHGDESTSFESCMALLYTLGASEEPRIQELLKQAVVIVNPTFNPDGHERFAVYHNSVGMNDPNNDAYEHGQPWAMYGRYNHYRFDMNRDKLAVSQPEVRQEIAEYLRWQPHVYVDQHGEVDQYFFPPVALAINPVFDVGYQQKWVDIFGRGNAAAFDRYGWDYFNRRTYDFFFVGYNDTFAALNGAIGMTYETDGGGNLGFAWARSDGTVITLRDGIMHHLTTALATIDTAVTHREERLRDYAAFRRAAVDEGRTGAMKRVVIVPGNAPDRAAQLVTTLRRVGVEVGVASGTFSSTAAHQYGKSTSTPAAAKRFDSGVYVVDLSQPQGRIARGFLDPEPQLNPEFVKDELAKRERNDRRGKNTDQESAGFYDITAWALPLAYDVEAYWLSDAVDVPAQQLGAPTDPDTGLRPAFLPEGRVTGGAGKQGYLWAYDSTDSAKLALALLREGYKVGVSPYPLKAGGRAFGTGTFVVRTMRNPDTLPARIQALARDTGVEVFAVDSQYADEATTGVGSEEIQQLKTPRILVAVGDGVAQTSYGALWYMLERELHYPFTAMDVDDIGGTDLSKFNVIVLPDGSSGRYASRIGKGGMEKIRAWVEAGGTLVGFGGASQYLADKDLKLTTARAVGSDDDQPPAEAPAAAPAADAQAKDTTEKGKAPEKKEAEKPVPATPLYVPGAIFVASVDHNYFLSYGYDRDTLPVPVNTDFFLRPSKDGANVLTFPKDVVRLAGFIWPKNTTQLLGGTAYLVDEPTGRGHVILFSEDVGFRRIWRGLDRFIYNALLFAPAR